MQRPYCGLPLCENCSMSIINGSHNSYFIVISNKNRKLFMLKLTYRKKYLSQSKLNDYIVKKVGLLTSIDRLAMNLILLPVLQSLKKYKLVVIREREFHSAELSHWLKVKSITQKISRFCVSPDPIRKLKLSRLKGFPS